MDYDKLFNPDARTSESTHALIVAAEACIDAFTAAFNARDAAGMDAHLHFPHVIFYGAQQIIWDKPRQLPEDFFEKLAESGWAKTVYEYKLPILVSPDKVHFRVCYTRRAADGSVLTRHENVWVVTRIADRWGIALRSY
jgi:hypothetical protein